MQKSRRALLQRRALENSNTGRTRWYKVSLSLVFVLWGLIFLLCLWISHGDGYTDEADLGHDRCSVIIDKDFLKDAIPVISNDSSCPVGTETGDSNRELISYDENTNRVSYYPNSVNKSEINDPKTDLLSSVPVGDKEECWHDGMLSIFQEKYPRSMILTNSKERYSHPKLNLKLVREMVWLVEWSLEVRNIIMLRLRKEQRS